MDSTPTSPYASTPVQQQQQQHSRPRRRSSFVRCYNCDQWFSCAQHLMQHKTAEHPMAEAVRKMGLKIVKDRESGSTAAIIPDMEAPTEPAPPLHHQHQQHSRPPVPDLQETEELLDRLKLLSVGQRTRRRQSRLFLQQQQHQQQQEQAPHCRQRRRITLDSPDTATAAAAAATAAAAAAEAAACQPHAFACQCGALLPDLPLVKQLHMRTNHDSPMSSQLQQQQFQQPPAMFSMVQLSPCSPCYSMHHHPSSIFLPAMAYQPPPPQQSATPTSHLIGYAFQPPLPQMQ